jgi:hypothetical protein
MREYFASRGGVVRYVDKGGDTTEDGIFLNEDDPHEFNVGGIVRYINSQHFGLNLESIHVYEVYA